MAWANVDYRTKNNILKFIDDVDQQCRKDIHNGFIISERDYVTRLTSLLTYPNGLILSKSNDIKAKKFRKVKSKGNTVKWVNKNGKKIKWVCRVNPPEIENAFGADAMIIIKSWDKNGYYSYKICFFEAKWPINSFGLARQNFDTTSTALNTSHYHTQLQDQNNLSNDFVKFSLYINAQKFGKKVTNHEKFNLYGATCAWTNDAFNYSNFAKKGISGSGVKWVVSDLGYFSNWLHRYGNSNFITLKEIGKQVLECKQGRPIRDIKQALNNEFIRTGISSLAVNEFNRFIDNSGILD